MTDTIEQDPTHKTTTHILTAEHYQQDADTGEEWVDAITSQPVSINERGLLVGIAGNGIAGVEAAKQVRGYISLEEGSPPQIEDPLTVEREQVRLALESLESARWYISTECPEKSYELTLAALRQLRAAVGIVDAPVPDDYEEKGVRK